MNARVGHLEDAACAHGRGCTDTVINAHGRQLISMCNSSGSLLCTGRVPGDETAPFSYKSTARSLGSRIDHVVVSQSLYGMMLACLVNVHRLETDHHPVECTLRLTVQHTQPQPCHGQPLLKRHWQPDLRACQCQQHLQAALTAAASGDVHTAFHSLHTAMGQAADVSGMRATSKQGKPGRTPSKPFFDR